MIPYKNNPPAAVHDSLSLVSLLKALGHEPVSTHGEELQYTSVLSNRGDNKPRLKVHDRLNTWFDSGLGKGGKLLDFARYYWPDLSADEIGERFLQIQNKLAAAAAADRKYSPRRKRKATKLPHYQIGRTGPLGYCEEITNFLMERGLWEIADLRMQEVYYYCIDQKGRRKDFCAVGWPTENGGWEVRARNFTDCIGPTGMSFISVSEKLLAIFPDYVDYLKNRHEKSLLYASILILNRPRFLPAAIQRARRFEKTLCYLDDTREGYQLASETLTGQLRHTQLIPL